MINKIIEPVKGYFVTLGMERTMFKNKSSLDAGRGGIFYKKEDLIATIQSKAALKKVPMDIVEIEIAAPHCCITNPNCQKFGVKGGEIKITRIQCFKEAAEEIMVEVA